MRINFYGGPGIGKSTATARVFAELKERHYSVEHVTEYVKTWAYQKRKTEEFDQIYIFGKQQQYEFRYLKAGVKNIVTDSPTFLSYYYAKKYISDEIAEAIWTLCKLYDKKYPCFNIMLERGEKPYHTEGRYQTEAEARLMDEEIWNELTSHYPPEQCVRIPYDQKEKILETVLSVISK